MTPCRNRLPSTRAGAVLNGMGQRISGAFRNVTEGRVAPGFVIRSVVEPHPLRRGGEIFDRAITIGLVGKPQPFGSKTQPTLPALNRRCLVGHGFAEIGLKKIVCPFTHVNQL